MNYSEMSDAEINRMVTRFIHPRDQSITPYNHRPDVQVFHRNSLSSMFDYCNSWADAGPIIVNNFISIQFLQGHWMASVNPSRETEFRAAALIDRDNPLRAAMIVFLMMQGGREEGQIEDSDRGDDEAFWDADYD